jgi:hypothetical protein
VVNSGGMGRSVDKVFEGAISYESVLLSQISYCSKAVKPSAYTKYPSTLAFISCVENLISLIPPNTKLKILRKYNEICESVMKVLMEYEDDFKFCRGNSPEHKKRISVCVKLVSDVYEVLKDKYPQYEHVLKEFIKYLVYPPEEEFQVYEVGRGKLLLAIAIEALIEDGLIGLEFEELSIGSVRG